MVTSLVASLALLVPLAILSSQAPFARRQARVAVAASPSARNAARRGR